MQATFGGLHHRLLYTLFQSMQSTGAAQLCDKDSRSFLLIRATFWETGGFVTSSRTHSKDSILMHGQCFRPTRKSTQGAIELYTGPWDQSVMHVETCDASEHTPGP